MPESTRCTRKNHPNKMVEPCLSSQRNLKILSYQSRTNRQNIRFCHCDINLRSMSYVCIMLFLSWKEKKSFIFRVPISYQHMVKPVVVSSVVARYVINPHIPGIVTWGSGLVIHRISRSPKTTQVYFRTLSRLSSPSHWYQFCFPASGLTIFQISLQRRNVKGDYKVGPQIQL